MAIEASRGVLTFYCPILDAVNVIERQAVERRYTPRQRNSRDLSASLDPRKVAWVSLDCLRRLAERQALLFPAFADFVHGSIIAVAAIVVKALRMIMFAPHAYPASGFLG